ncbi:MAG: PilZ domain-containing protein [Pseudomonadota bacterium]|nr:PilZ domain-containing protein [Pseudomonadota bacterium]
MDLTRLLPREPTKPARVSRSEEITRLLMRALRQNVAFKVLAPRTPSSATITLSALGAQCQWLGFDAPLPRRVDPATLAGKVLTLKGRLDGGLLWLRNLEPISNVASENTTAGAALYYAWPTAIDHLQRRDGYRVNLANHQLQARLSALSESPDSPPSVGRLHDLSLGGCCVQFDAAEGWDWAVGQQYGTCAIETPEGPAIQCTLEVRHCRSTRDGLTRVGFRLLEVDDSRGLSRLIQSLQRARLRAESV